MKLGIDVVYVKFHVQALGMLGRCVVIRLLFVLWGGLFVLRRVVVLVEEGVSKWTLVREGRGDWEPNGSKLLCEE